MRLTAALSGSECLSPRNEAVPLRRSATDGGDVRAGLASAAALRTTAGGQPLQSLPLFPTSARSRLKHACGKHFWEWKRRNSAVGRQPRRPPTHPRLRKPLGRSWSSHGTPEHLFIYHQGWLWLIPVMPREASHSFIILEAVESVDLLIEAPAAILHDYASFVPSVRDRTSTADLR